MQQVFHLKGADGEDYDVPNSELENFRKAMPDAVGVGSYRGKDGSEYDVPDSERENFQSAVPDAQPMRRLSFADGSTRDFTMPKLSKFLRSKEWREDERYAADREAFREQEAARGLPTEQGSAGWAGTKGAIAGAAHGAVAGANAAASKVLAAIPEAAASVAEAAGNALSGMGNAKNPVGEWLRNSGKGVKDWLNANVKTTAADQLGYTDDLVKLGDIAGDAAGMAVKFAPAAVAGPGYVEAILASDGINAYRDTHDAAIEKGWNEAQANVAGATAGLINLLGQFLLGGGVASATMGAQAAGNKAVENTIEGKPFFKGTGGAFMEGLTEGAAFHVLNAAGHGGKATMEARRETASLKEMRKENLLTVAENGGGDFLDRVTRSEGMEEAVKARKEGKDVSRKMGERADLPDNMSVAERNEVVDAIVGAREEKAEAAKKRIAREEAEIAAQPGDERVAESQMKEADAAAHAERQSELQKTFDEAKPAEAPKTTEEPAPRAEEPPPQKPAAEAPRSAPRTEGTTTPPKATEGAESGKTEEKTADRFLSLVDKIADERKRGTEAERKAKTDDEFSRLYDANFKRQQSGWDALKAEIDALSADELYALQDALYSRASGFPGSRERAELRQQLREYVGNAWRKKLNTTSAENVAPSAENGVPKAEAPESVETGAKSISDMSKAEINARFKEIVGRMNREGASQEEVEAAAREYEDLKKAVNKDGRFVNFSSIGQGDLVPKSHDVYEKPTDADYKAWRKKQGGIRDSKNARKRFENAWRKEHRGAGEADAESPKEPTPAPTPTERTASADAAAKKAKAKGFKTTSHVAYDEDGNSGSNGMVRHHHENGGRLYSLPVDVDATRANGGRVVLDKNDPAYGRLSELLEPYKGKLRLSKNGNLYFKDGKGVPKELRELLGRELKIGKNAEDPFSATRSLADERAADMSGDARMASDEPIDPGERWRKFEDAYRARRPSRTARCRRRTSTSGSTSRTWRRTASSLRNAASSRRRTRSTARWSATLSAWRRPQARSTTPSAPPPRRARTRIGTRPSARSRAGTTAWGRRTSTSSRSAARTCGTRRKVI